VKSYLQHPPSDLTDRCAITVTMLLEYAIQIAHGLLYLESQSFVHGDLAACNIMRTSAQQASLLSCILLLLTAFELLSSTLLSTHADRQGVDISFTVCVCVCFCLFVR